MSKQKYFWQVGRVYKNAVFDNKGDIAADCHSPQTAKFIVKACNNHDRLVEALEHCIEIMEDSDVPDHLVETYGSAIMNYSNLLTELKS